MTDEAATSIGPTRTVFRLTHERWQKLTEWPLLAAAGVFLAAYSVQVIGNVSDRHAAVLNEVIWFTWGLFIIDYVAQLILTPQRTRWFFRNLHEVVILALPALRPLRLLRLVTVVRVFHRFAGSTLRDRVLAYVLGSAIILTYVGALAVLDAEENAPGSNIKNFGDAMWWAVVTITTVGYGDHYPITFVGRLVAVGLMVGGVAVIGVVTASVAAWLVEQVRTTTVKQVKTADADLEAQVTEILALLREQKAANENTPMEALPPTG